jgi:hypothetical protein
LKTRFIPPSRSDRNKESPKLYLQLGLSLKDWKHGSRDKYRLGVGATLQNLARAGFDVATPWLSHRVSDRERAVELFQWTLEQFWGYRFLLSYTLGQVSLEVLV